MFHRHQHLQSLSPSSSDPSMEQSSKTQQQHRDNNGAPATPQFPKPITRSEPGAYPTTFVQADTTTFKRVVQMLTGSSETTNHSPRPPPPDPPSKSAIPIIKTVPNKQSFKLYERRSLVIIPGLSHRRQPEILSPSILDFPKLALGSPVTPLSSDPFGRSLSSEDRAIAEKGFYLHPSPRDGAEPRLLPLFPITSPGVAGVVDRKST